MNRHDALVLHRRTRAPNQASLHSREIELRLSDDGRHIVLSRYLELYSEPHSGWCSARHHRISLARMVRWMISHGLEVQG